MIVKVEKYQISTSHQFTQVKFGNKVRGEHKCHLFIYLVTLFLKPPPHLAIVIWKELRFVFSDSSMGKELKNKIFNFGDGVLKAH